MDLLGFEKEALGLYVSEHPLSNLTTSLRRATDCSIEGLGGRRDGEVVTVAGMIGGTRVITTRKGDPMAFLRLEDLSGSVEVLLFSSVYRSSQSLVESEAILLIRGRVDRKEGEVKFIALEVSELPYIDEVRMMLR